LISVNLQVCIRLEFYAKFLQKDGTMARVPQLLKIAEQFDLKIITGGALMSTGYRREKLVQRIVSTRLPSQYGEFQMYLFRSQTDNKDHIALVKGDISPEKPTLCSCPFRMFDR